MKARARPLLYGTTPQFLERLGLPSLAALPSLAPLLSARRRMTSTTRPSLALRDEEDERRGRERGALRPEPGDD